MHSFISSVRKYRKTAGFAAGCAGGLLLFWVMYGFSVLDPANFGWCLTKPDDTAQHCIGTWAFLRDAWHWPPGLFYGLSDPDPASITVIDGIPLAALLVKLCRGVKAEPFQYLGIWGMICFMLQGGFGFLLTGRFTRRFWSQLAGAFFILLAVPFLTRYPLHTALSSHFLILWALYLMLGKWSTRTACAWTVLLGLALSIHPYLAAMCLAVYAGVTLQRLIRARQKKRFPAAANVLVSWLVTALVCSAVPYLAGVFSIGMENGGGGFGQTHIDLNGLFNPVKWHVSALITPMPCRDSAENIYLGAGLCLLVLAALPRLRRIVKNTSPMWRKYGIAFVILLAMALFAVNCRVYLGGELLLNILPPQWIRSLGSVFRAAGRFVWPAWYLLAALAVGLAARRKNRLSGTLLLAAAVLLQCYDLGSGIVAHTWAERIIRPEAEYVSPYQAVDTRPGEVERICCTPHDEDFNAVGHFALSRGLVLEDYYFARDFRRTERPNRMKLLLENGVAAPGCLYLLRKEERKELERRHPRFSGRLLTTPGRSVLIVPRAGTSASSVK